MLQPLDPGRWTENAAAHLLNRAGFGGPPHEVAAMHRLGLEAAVAALVDGEGVPVVPLEWPDWAHPDPDRRQTLRQFRDASEEERRRLREQQQRETRRRVEDLKRWWLGRMVASPRPLEEKLVLFWHGHFATSIQKVRDPWLMVRQLDLFYRRGLGPWPRLLREVTWDPAMLIWLDQAQSRREHPNENYAREVMELFALGEGHYSEKDILETARALTGLTLNRETQEAEWRPRIHDPGVKTVLGQSGAFGPDEVIAVIASQPQSARHLVGRLWRFFAHENLPPEVMEGLVAEYQRSGGEVRAVLRCLFRSEAFYAPEVVRSQIKSPVQWLVCALRELERPLPPGPMVLGALRELGQDLLAPPNVKGWDGGLAWINTSTLTRRQEWAALLVDGRDALAAQASGPRGERLRQRMAGRGGRSSGASRLLPLFPEADRGSRDALFRALERRFLHSPMRASLAEELREVLGDDPVPEPRAIPEAVRVVLQSTDYQVT